MPSPSLPLSPLLLFSIATITSQLSSPRKAIVINAIQNPQSASTAAVYLSRLHLHLHLLSVLIKKPLHYFLLSAFCTLHSAFCLLFTLHTQATWNPNPIPIPIPTFSSFFHLLFRSSYIRSSLPITQVIHGTCSLTYHHEFLIAVPLLRA